MHKGVAPDGSHYFLVFPYPAFAFLKDKDLKAVKDNILTLPGIRKPNKPHDLSFPFNVRLGQVLWKLLYFSEGHINSIRKNLPNGIGVSTCLVRLLIMANATLVEVL